MAQSCLAIVEQRWRNAITTAQAIFGLLKALPENGSLAAFTRYVEQLAEVECDQAITLIRGHHVTAPVPGDEAGLPEGAGGLLPTNGTKRAYHDLDDEPDSNRGKSLVDGSLFAWRNLATSHTPTDPRLELTLKLKQNYHLDVKAGKAEIVNHPCCPIFLDNL